jgi:hypothetical protein
MVEWGNITARRKHQKQKLGGTDPGGATHTLAPSEKKQGPRPTRTVYGRALAWTNTVTIALGGGFSPGFVTTLRDQNGITLTDWPLALSVSSSVTGTTSIRLASRGRPGDEGGTPQKRVPRTSWSRRPCDLYTQKGKPTVLDPWPILPLQPLFPRNPHGRLACRSRPTANPRAPITPRSSCCPARPRHDARCAMLFTPNTAGNAQAPTLIRRSRQHQNGVCEHFACVLVRCSSISSPGKCQAYPYLHLDDGDPHGEHPCLARRMTAGADNANITRLPLRLGRLAHVLRQTSYPHSPGDTMEHHCW